MNNELTVFLFGGGQDSHAILYKMAYDQEFRKKYAPNRLLILMSDTGEEHPSTYKSVNTAVDFAKKHGFEFHFITNDKGFHSDPWMSLTGQYKRNSTVGSVAFPQTCTDNLEVKVVDRFLEDWLSKNYGVKCNRKRGFYEFFEKHGKITYILGIAKGEERRLDPEGKNDPIWKRKTCIKSYPLIEIGMDRIDCQRYIVNSGHHLPTPSNCMICFYMSLQELLWLYRFLPGKYQELVELERVKIEKNVGQVDPNKNLGVFGSTQLIPDRLKVAVEKYGHLSDEELNEYKMSHGHCVKSKY